MFEEYTKLSSACSSQPRVLKCQLSSTELIKLHKQRLAGCFELSLVHRPDDRGSFVKSMQASKFMDAGLETNFVESFYTRSRANVIRGMHFQLPPADGAKLVYCLEGEILDVALDLRTGSTTFGQSCTFRLSAAKSTAAYIPSGVAHGFCVLTAPALMMYHVSSEHNAVLDAGIRWDSFGFEWPCAVPVVSARDASLPRFADFDSPFRFESR